jgi:hypothetical protein
MKIRFLASLACILISFCGFTQKHLQLLRFSSVELCDSVHVNMERIRPTLHARNHSQDATELSIRVRANCENNRYGALAIENDTLRLYFFDKGFVLKKKNLVVENGYKPYQSREFEVAMCDCYFQMTYLITSKQPLPENIKINGDLVYPRSQLYRLTAPTFELYGRDTVNYSDETGRMQGRWVALNEQGKIVEENFYRDDKRDSMLLYTYHDNYLFKKEVFISDSIDYSEIEFYPSGKVRQNCVTTMRYVRPTVAVDERSGRRSFGIQVQTCWIYSEEGKLIDIKSNAVK